MTGLTQFPENFLSWVPIMALQWRTEFGTVNLTINPRWRVFMSFLQKIPAKTCIALNPCPSQKPSETVGERLIYVKR